MSRLKPGLSITLDDEKAERANVNHEDRIDELQGLPFASARIVRDVSLADTIGTLVAHGLGRVPQWLGVSVVRGATATGRIVESRAGTHDRTKFTLLTATGHGATISIDLVFV